MRAALGPRCWLLHLAVDRCCSRRCSSCCRRIHHGMLARIMVLAVFAMGYNMLYGYVGLLSLGHAMFFARRALRRRPHHAASRFGRAGGLPRRRRCRPGAWWPGRPAGAADHRRRLHDRHHDVRAECLPDDPLLRRGPAATRASSCRGRRVDLPRAASSTSPSRPSVQPALAVLTACLLAIIWLVRSPLGRVLVAIRENEERTRMLGYDTFLNKLVAVVVSGTLRGVAGAAYALLFGYVGSTFAGSSIRSCRCCGCCSAARRPCSGPLVGTLFMYYVVDITSGYTRLPAGRRRCAAPARAVSRGHPRQHPARAGRRGCRDPAARDRVSPRFGGLRPSTVSTSAWTPARSGR